MLLLLNPGNGSGVSSSGLEVAIEYSKMHAEAVFDLKSMFFVYFFFSFFPSL